MGKKEPGHSTDSASTELITLLEKNKRKVIACWKGKILSFMGKKAMANKAAQVSFEEKMLTWYETILEHLRDPGYPQKRDKFLSELRSRGFLTRYRLSVLVKQQHQLQRIVLDLLQTKCSLEEEKLRAWERLWIEEMEVNILKIIDFYEEHFETQVQTEYMKYQNAMERSHDIIYTLDREGNLIYVNPVTESITGYTKGELIGKNFVSFTPPESVDAMLQVFEKLMQGKKVAPFEVMLAVKDGKQVPIEVAPHCFWEEGRITGVWCIARDLTEKKHKEQERAELQQELIEAKERYRFLVENSNDVIYILDSETRLSYVGPQIERVLGYPPEELLGHSFAELLPPESMEITLNHMTRALEGEEITAIYQVEIYKKDGTLLPMEVSVSYLYRGEELIGRLGTARDISQRKKIEADLARQNLRLTNLNEITQILTSTLTTKEILQNALSKSIEILTLEGGMIALVDRDTDTFRLAAYVDFPHGPDLYREFIDRPIGLGEGVSGRVVQAGTPMIIDNFSEGPEARRDLVKKAGIKTYVSIPIKVKEKVLGALGLVSRHAKRFDSEDISLMESIGRGIGAALENSRLYTETKEAKDYLNKLIDSSPDSIMITDKHGIITSSNKSTEEIFGYKAGDLIGTPMSRYYANGVEDAKKIMQLLENYNWVREYEVNIVNKDNVCVPTRISASVVRDITGEILAIIGIGRDLRERKKLEEEIRATKDYLESLIESSIDGVMTIDNAGNLVFVNRGAQDIFGYASEEVISRPIHEFFLKGEQEALHIAELLRERGSLRNYFLEAVTKDGQVLSVSCSLSYLKKSDGKIMGTIGVVKDITEQRRLEKQFLESEKMRVLGEMASGVAHNFNNLLAVILGSTQILLGQELGPQSERIKKHLERIELASIDGAEMIKRIQEFSRIRQDTNFIPLDVNDIVGQSTEITMPRWKDQAQQRGITIDVISELGEVPAIKGNPGELREVLINLIFNAIDALPKGGQIFVRTRRERDQVILEVTDNGIGMSKEVRDKMFDPFFTTKGGNNTGIGLSVSYGVITRHRGAIDVKSEEGKGTAFTVKLPVSPETGIGEKVLPQTQEIKTANILAIDDEELVLDLLSEMVTFLGHRITIASTAQEGLKIFEDSLKLLPQSERFDIVMTDLGMPSISGWQMAESIKNLDPDTVVIMITGWQPEINVNESKERGIDILLGKPFEMAKLRQTIEEAIYLKKRS